MSDYEFDNLAICTECGDRYVEGGGLCRSCLEQQSIDAHESGEDQEVDFEPDDCAVSGHSWEYVGMGCYVCIYCDAEDCDD